MNAIFTEVIQYLFLCDIELSVYLGLGNTSFDNVLRKGLIIESDVKVKYYTMKLKLSTQYYKIKTSIKF